VFDVSSQDMLVNQIYATAGVFMVEKFGKLPEVDPVRLDGLVIQILFELAVKYESLDMLLHVLHRSLLQFSLK
jgi:hypothetical protein